MTIVKKAVYINDRINKAFLVNIEGSTLTGMQRLVEGLIDIVDIDIDGLANDDQTVMMVVNDEGLFNSKFTPNWVATGLYGNMIVGPVVILLCDRDGDSVGLSDKQVDYLVKTMADRFDTFDGNGWTVDSLLALVDENEQALTF